MSTAVLATLIGIGALAFAGALVAVVYVVARRLAADPGLAEFAERVEQGRADESETGDEAAASDER